MPILLVLGGSWGWSLGWWRVYLNERIIFNFSVVVNEQLFCGVIVEWINQLKTQNKFVSLCPDVVHMLIVAVVQSLEMEKQKMCFNAMFNFNDTG